MNSIIITGNLVRDPEQKQTESGVSVTTFTVAVRDGSEKTYFLDCVAFRKTADFVTSYFRKGNGIAIRGHLTQRKYTDKNNLSRVAHEIVADEVDFFWKKTETPEATKPVEKKPEEPAKFVDLGDQDLPF